MIRLRASIAAKLVLGYGLLGTVSVIVVAAVFYVGTIGVLDQNIDAKIGAVSRRLMEKFQSGPHADLVSEIEAQLSDGIDSEREIFLLLAPDGRRRAGNVTSWSGANVAPDIFLNRDVVRDGKVTPARLLLRHLAGGAVLVVGRDLQEQESIRALVWRSLATGVALSLLLTVFGALLFRQQIERRIGAIRRAAQEIGAGDLSRRIPALDNDEFGLLNRDINRMLDRIEHLMEGIRHVSNAIAHDLRTPLSRVRSKLEDALLHGMTVGTLSGAAQGAIEDIDELIRLFERLLQIAEAESGMRGKWFDCVDVNQIALDMVDMYEASAEDCQVRLSATLGAPVLIQGDRNLLASALASLIDNAIKYAGAGAHVDVRTNAQENTVSMTVCDNGPGIPTEERGKVTERFYRLDKSRGLPGNGLGLAIVSATASLHAGKLNLEDGRPGLIASIVLPRPAIAAVRK